MNQRCLLGLILLLGAGAVRVGADDDRDRLQGTWKVLSAQKDGEKLPAADVPMEVLTFTRDRVRLGEEGEGRFTVDAGKEPKQITLTLPAPEGEKPETAAGIYKIEGNRLTLCLGEKARPTAFRTKKGDECLLLVAERMSEADVKRYAAQKAEENTALNLYGMFLASVNSIEAQQELLGDRPLPRSEATFSWRVHLLPYLEQSELYNTIDRNQPWDGARNKKLLERMPRTYAVPGKDQPSKGVTHYRRVILPGGERARFLIVVEAAEGVPWTKPGTDLVLAPDRPLPKFGGSSPDGFFALCADGKIRFLKKDLEDKAVRAALLRGEGVKPYDVSAVLRKRAGEDTPPKKDGDKK